MRRTSAKRRFGLVAAVISALGFGWTAAGMLQSGEAADVYHLAFGDPPDGVRSVLLKTPSGYLGCYRISQNRATRTPLYVSDGDLLYARWHSDPACGAATNRYSSTAVAPPVGDTFMFLLASNG